MAKLEAGSILSGAYGSFLVSGTTDYTTQEFVALVALEDTVIANLEEAHKDGSVVSSSTNVLAIDEQNLVTAVTIVIKGAILYPRRDMFNRVKLTSGSFMGYRRD